MVNPWLNLRKVARSIPLFFGGHANAVLFVLFAASTFLLAVRRVSLSYLVSPAGLGGGGQVAWLLNWLYSATGIVVVYNLPYYASEAVPPLLSFFYVLLPAVLVLREIAYGGRGWVFTSAAVFLLADFSGLPFYGDSALYVRMLPLFAYGAARGSALFNSGCMRLFSRIERAKPGVLVALLLLVAFSLRLAFIGYDSSLRSFSDGNEAYAGYRIFGGHLPYRDFVYTHLPLAPFLIAFFYKLAGAGLFEARLLNAIVNVLGILPLYWLASRFFGRVAAFVAALFWAFYPLSLKAGSFVSVDSFMVFFMLVSVVFFFRQRNLFLSGLMLGVAVLSKESAALTLVPFFAYLCVTRQLKRFGWLAGGFAVPLLSVPYFYSLSPANFVFILQFHANIFRHSFFEKLSVFWSELFAGNLAVLLVFAIGFGAVLGRRSRDSLFVLWWFLPLFVLFLNRVFWWKYGLQFLPAFAMFIGVAAGDSLGPGVQRAVSSRGFPAHCFFALAALSLLAAGLGFVVSGNDDGARVARVLAGATAPGDYVVSPMLQIPLLAGREVPGELQEFGVQNALLGSDAAIGVARRYNVTAVVVDARILDAGHLAGFRDYVFSNFHAVPLPELEERNLALWVR